jgi:hypothetical protein
VEDVGVALGGLVPGALSRDRMHDDRAVVVAGPFDRVLNRLHIVTVDGPDVGPAQLLEEHARHDELLERLLGGLTRSHHRRADAGNAGDT